MKTPPENDFAQLRRLLSLKSHEQPPPGYFNNFPSDIIASIKAERRGRRRSEASGTGPLWILRFLEQLQAKPALAGVVGAGLCALVIGGIIVNEQGSKRPAAMPSLLTEMVPEAQPAAASAQPLPMVFQPVMADATISLMASNNLQPAPATSLFDAIPDLDTQTVGHR